MTQIYTMPSGERFEFPDTATKEQIKDFLNNHFEEERIQSVSELNNISSKNPNRPPDNTFIVDNNIDGSKKYSFDTIYQDKELIANARPYYEKKGMKFFNDEDVVDQYISDRTWKQANITSAAKQLYEIESEDDTEQLQRLGYLVDYWNKLPNFWEEGGRSATSAITSNLIAGVLDPTNLLSFGVGSTVAKTIGKQPITATTKGAIKKEIAKRTALIAGGTAGFDGALVAYGDYTLQEAEKNLGLRDEIDKKRLGTSFVLGAGISVLPNGAFAYAGIKKELPDVVEKNLPKGKNVENFTKSIGESEETISPEPISNTWRDKIVRRGLDLYNPFAILQKKVRGIGESEEALAKALDKKKEVGGVAKSEKALAIEYQKGGTKITLKEGDKIYDKRIDPVSNPYYQFRLLSNSTARAEDFISDGVKLPEGVYGRVETVDGTTVGINEFTPTGNKGIVDVIKPFDAKGEAESLLLYVAAKRTKNIIDSYSKKPKDKRGRIPTTPMDLKTAREMIDWVELDDASHIAKYGEVSNRSRDLDYRQATNDLVKYLDDLLAYQVRSEIISPEDALKIKKANPIYIPFYGFRQMEDTGVVPSFRGTLKSIKAPGKKRAKTVKKGQINPFFTSIIEYSVGSVVAGDKNRAKVSLYDLIDEGVLKGKIGKDELVKKVSSVKVGYAEVLTKDLVKKLDNMGIKISKDDLNLKDTFTTAAFLNNFETRDGRFIDVVFRKGKAEFYEVLDKSLLEAYQSTGGLVDTQGWKVFEAFSRLPAKAITYSPPFVAFNWIRDSLSATINSSFGFIPIYSSLKGFFKTFGGRVDQKGFINMFKKNDDYRKALVNGMGYASRGEIERLGIKFENYGKTLANAYYKKSLNNIFTRFLSKGARGYVELVGRIEYASRLAHRELAKNRGFSEIAASFAGREVSTDFGMRGSSRFLQAYSSITMFLNAGLQGFYRGVRAIKENPKKSIPMLGATIVAPELGLWHMLNGRKEYEELPDEIKQLNYTIPLFQEDVGDGTHLYEDGTRRIKDFILIPKPYDFGVFANVATAIVEGFKKNTPIVTAEYAWESILRILPGYNKGTVFALPTVANPFFQLAFNTNWTGSPIMPYNMEELAEVDKNIVIKTNTRESAIKMARLWNNMVDGFGPKVTPITVDYVMNSYLTGLLSYPADLADAIIYDENLFGERVDERSDRADFARKPWTIVTRRFQANTPVKNSKYLQKLYDIYQRAKKESTALSKKLGDKRLLLEIIGTDEVNLTNKKAVEYMAISPFLSDVVSKLAELRKLRLNIKYDKSLSGSEKRTQIDEIIAIENQIAEKTIKAIYNSNLDSITKTVFGVTDDDPNAEAIRLFGGE